MIKCDAKKRFSGFIEQNRHFTIGACFETRLLSQMSAVEVSVSQIRRIDVGELPDNVKGSTVKEQRMFPCSFKKDTQADEQFEKDKMASKTTRGVEGQKE